MIRAGSVPNTSPLQYHDTGTQVPASAAALPQLDKMGMVLALLLLLAAPRAVLVAILVHSPRALMASERPLPSCARPQGWPSVTSRIAGRAAHFREVFSYFNEMQVHE